MVHLTHEQANKVYDLLVCYGATPTKREYLLYLCEDHPWGYEFRFMGIFGRGGELLFNSYDGLRANYYPEDRTPELDQKMETLNQELKEFWNEFRSVT